MSQPTILINLQRCTGCWTCSLACKAGNQLADDEWWQYIKTLGDGSGIDRPAGTWPALQMSWQPIFTQRCTLCGERTSKGLEPYCVYNCSNLAMTYGDLEDPQSDVTQKVEELRGRGYKLYLLPEWEQGRSGILYARKV